MTAPNVALLRQTLEYIETHPDEWNQSQWVTPARYRDNPSCSTAYCFAGWAVVLSGHKFVNQYGDVACEDAPDVERRRVAQAGTVHIADVATNLLQISHDDAHDLFYDLNTLDDLRRHVAELCAEAETAVS